MSGRRDKGIRRAIKKARGAVIMDSFERTLSLPFRERLEIAIAILTRRRPWIITAWLVGLALWTLIAVLAWGI